MLCSAGFERFGSQKRPRIRTVPYSRITRMNMIQQNSIALLDSPNISIDEGGNLRFNDFKVDPFFYTLSAIPWDLFLINHYKGDDYARDNEFAERNRRTLLASVFRQSKESLGLASNDIQYFGCTEKRGARCHTHTLIYIKRKAGANASELRETIQKCLPSRIVTIPEASTKERANQIVIEPVKCAAYVSKRNKNDLAVPTNHYSKDFITFATRYNKF